MSRNACTVARTARRAAVSLLAACALGAGGAPSSARAQAGAPLFSSSQPLELTLTAPMRTLVNRRRRRPEVDGVLSYTDGGERVELDVEVTTRGHSRLELCSFPPLSLNLKRGQLPGTLFAGQNKLKLVTRCRDSGDFAQYLELEHLAYRIYEQITEYAFRTRPVRMRYVDTDRDGRAETAPAFFLEHEDGVADRVGMRALEVESVDAESLAPRELALLGVIEFVIGNTDWSALDPAEGEHCCHNTAVLAPRGAATGRVAVPFDFDQAGLVDAPYALPDERLRLDSVRERLYRGFCSVNAELDGAVAAFNGARGAIEALFAQAPLAAAIRDGALDYLAEGYAVLNDPGRRAAEIEGVCRTPRVRR